MKAYLLKINDNFTLLPAETSGSFEYEIEGSSSVFLGIEPGDYILGYYSKPINQVKIALYVRSALTSEKIIVEKTLEINNGPSLSYVLEQNMLNHDLLEISISQCKDLINQMVNSFYPSTSNNSYVDVARTILNDSYEETIAVCENDFVEWLKSAKGNDGRTLREDMQIQYHYLLKAVPSMYGYKDVFSINDLSEFERYDTELRETQTFRESYRCIGNGALSAALSKYKAYLKERTDFFEDCINGFKTNEELALILKQWYDSNPVQDKRTSSLVGFGVKYGYSIKKNNITAKQLFELAGITPQNDAYIDRGVDLYSTLIEGTIGLRFAKPDSNIYNSGQAPCYYTQYESRFPRNRIIFGAPGTGKSFMLERERKTLIGENNETDYERVTFHPDYSYANFVGTYKPVPSVDNDGKETITYEYVPGPFMRVYVNALKSGRTEDPKPFLLIIEEINRANVAAVFGDIFQLLDRGNNNVSEYPIHASEDMKKYLAKKLGGESDDYSSIKLPDNMFIWATMNSADQGVFPMDTAFKRRWDFTYIGIDDNDGDIQGKIVELGVKEKHKVEWNELRKAINSFLAKQKINEDKQIGPYFISRKIVVPKSDNDIDSSAFIKAFKNKLIMYLFEDAAKQKRSTLFAGCNGKERYSEICNAFDEKGIGIFCQEIVNAIKPIDASTPDSENDKTGDEQA